MKRPTKKISGTREWSVKSVNCVSGCEHRCRYCYARYNAVERYGRIATGDWPAMQIRPHDVRKRHKDYGGRVMFPTTHDVTPSVIDACCKVIGNILDGDNELLIVSKPHLSCIERICRDFHTERDRILFRFSIGAMDDSILLYWEPGAPLFEERFACLRHAHRNGFGTSISAEPLLDADHAVQLFRTLEPYVTDSIWFGKMNAIRSRVIAGTSAKEIARIEAGQTDDAIRRLYRALKDEREVRWKESYKAVLGIKEATTAGLDK